MRTKMLPASMLCSKLHTPFRQPARRFEQSEPPSIAAGISRLLQPICEWFSLDSLRVNQQHSAPSALKATETNNPKSPFSLGGRQTQIVEHLFCQSRPTTPANSGTSSLCGTLVPSKLGRQSGMLGMTKTSSALSSGYMGWQVDVVLSLPHRLRSRNQTHFPIYWLM